MDQLEYTTKGGLLSAKICLNDFLKKSMLKISCNEYGPQQ